MDKCWILMGGNIGDRMAYLREASSKIEKEIGVAFKRSKIYESEAWGIENQNNFLNQIMIVQTLLSPREVLDKCLEIEKHLGRARISKWAERTIDIDILYFEDRIQNEAHLTIPHPEIQNRRFVLQPLTEISPDYIHPKFQQTNNALLKKCPDQLKVWEF